MITHAVAAVMVTEQNPKEHAEYLTSAKFAKVSTRHNINGSDK
jgi:hypothetical protein